MEKKRLIRSLFRTFGRIPFSCFSIPAGFSLIFPSKLVSSRISYLFDFLKFWRFGEIFF